MGDGKPQAPGFSFEMVDTVSLGALTLPTFKFISTDSGTTVTNSTIPLPVLSLAGLSLAPQYGEQKLSLLASPLSGLKLKPQKVRGFSVSTTHGSNAFTLMLGQLSGKKTGFVGVPSVLAFTGTLQPSSRLTFAPRVVTHLGSQSRPGSTDTSVGAGVSAVLSSHVKLIGDIAETRTKRGRWAPSVVVGSVGTWSRWSVEASLRRTDQDDAGRMTQALTFKIDRVGTLELRAALRGVSVSLRSCVIVASSLLGALLVLPAATGLAALGDALPGDIVGVWDTGDGAHVEVYERDGKYHGKFVRFYEEPPAGGVDVKNPDPALRARPLVGADFILNFEFDGKKWTKGRIYNPENGKQYKADLELQDGVLQVRGWIGMRLIGRTVEWTRAD